MAFWAQVLRASWGWASTADQTCSEKRSESDSLWRCHVVCGWDDVLTVLTSEEFPGGADEEGMEPVTLQLCSMVASETPPSCRGSLLIHFTID